MGFIILTYKPNRLKMHKNYFILNRLALELNNELKGFRIIRAFSFEKDRLVLHLLNKHEELSIEISVNPGIPYLNLRNNISIPKRNLIDFFNSHLPLTILAVEISEGDRILRLNADKAFIYFAIRGKLTNIYLISDEESLESFKKTDEEIIINFKDEVQKHHFISEFNIPKIEFKFIEPEAVRKKYPIIGKDIINEIKLRKGNADRISTKDLLNVLDEIKNNNPAVFIDENTDEVNLGVESFNIFPFTRKENFPNLIKALNLFLVQKFSRGTLSDKKRIIEKYLEKELNKLSGKLNDVNFRLQKGTREDEYNKIANLLLININKISKGTDKIELQDIYNNDISFSAKLDPKFSPKQNVDSYFEKARNEKIKFEKSKQLSSGLEKKYSELKNIKENFLNAETNEDYNFIMKKLNLKQEEKKKPDDEIKNKFRHYLIHNKYNVFVGKDSKSNDLLTLKFAKQNDYWFHARGVSGSHVILKNDNPKEGVPKNILKIVSSIAAYHSKAKTSGLTPVSYTQKKYVTKKKGMEPGKVALLREEVLIVKPEIPQGCEYLIDE